MMRNSCGSSRWLSVASRTRARTIVSRVPGGQIDPVRQARRGGRFTTHVHRTLRAGDRLAVRGPSGSFHAEAQPQDQIVLVAAGSGMTPMMSMIRARRGRVALLYSSRSKQEIIFAEELARLAQDDPDRLSVTHVLTERDGRLDAAGVHRWLTGLTPAPGAHYYVCGPEPLMDAVQGVLAGTGRPGRPGAPGALHQRRRHREPRRPCHRR